jgi:2-phosphosulfolactate phosphatase
MRISRARGLQGAEGAQGAVVVIDVLRAFTTAAYALAPRLTPPHPPTAPHPPGEKYPGGRPAARAVAEETGKRGAREIWLVSTPEEALALRAADPGLVLAGEVGGRPIPGFDHGNSPERMAALDLDGRTLVLRSSSGVRGALAAAHTCTELWLASLVTASATARAVRAAGGEVTLLAMGSPAGPDGPEDDACADLLEALLREQPCEHGRIVRMVSESPAAQQALDPAIDWITPGDLECALAIDRFGFAIRARVELGRVVARIDGDAALASRPPGPALLDDRAVGGSPVQP